MNLSELSDYEINVKILNIKFPGCSYEDYLVSSTVSLLCPDKPSLERDYNWCTDDALAFRLMFDNLICPQPWSKDGRLIDGEEFPIWEASQYWWKEGLGHCSAFNKNPNRAIAECFILMNQGGDND